MNNILSTNQTTLTWSSLVSMNVDKESKSEKKKIVFGKGGSGRGGGLGGLNFDKESKSEKKKFGGTEGGEGVWQGEGAVVLEG